jgi:16S rRNA (cytosine1402-N4)-methyltransferase
VKNYMKTGNTRGELKKDFYGNPETGWKPVNRKVITPGDEELKDNSRARSAKLRIAEKI